MNQQPSSSASSQAISGSGPVIFGDPESGKKWVVVGVVVAVLALAAMLIFGKKKA